VLQQRKPWVAGTRRPLGGPEARPRGAGHDMGDWSRYVRRLWEQPGHDDRPKTPQPAAYSSGPSPALGSGGSPGIGTLPKPTISSVTSAIALSTAAPSGPLATSVTPFDPAR
jgi:hypothetical protein